ncbi:hypothetical protein ABPG75_010501 [Micractinium tetrahymenae]
MLARLHSAAARSAVPAATAATAAIAAATGRAGFASSASAATEGAQEKDCLYAVLGVAQTATEAELKAAFRKRAKELHPDAAPHTQDANAPAFVRLLTAYKVLSNPRARQLYDLSRDAGGPSVLRAAAAAGVEGAADAAYEEAPVDLSWGLGTLFGGPARGPEGGALDHMRRELQGELHSAVRRAYLGPKLSPDELGAGWLPDAFEADERATQDCPDLLQLVSGRQVLGVVRERRAELLPRAQAAAAGELAESWAAEAAALPAGAQGQQGSGPAVQAAGDCGGAGEREAQQAHQAAAQTDCVDHHTQQQGAAETGQQEQPAAGQRAQQVQQAAQQAQQAQQAEREPDYLDLYVGGQLVATAVRRFPAGRTPGSSASGSTSSSSSSSSSSPTGSTSSHTGQERPAPAEVVALYAAGPGGQLLAQVEAQQLDPGSATASSARLLDAQGRHTHTVYRTQTPLVRHLTFAAEPAATGLRTHRPSRLVVCRARRAWLPPSSLWLFRPLSHQHDVGGWYLEWAGREQAGHPAALHPAVFVLIAAVDSLDHGRAARQPLGLFGRLRAERAAGQPEGAAVEAGGGWRGWVASVLRFHGRG